MLEYITPLCDDLLYNAERNLLIKEWHLQINPHNIPSKYLDTVFGNKADERFNHITA